MAINVITVLNGGVLCVQAPYEGSGMNPARTFGSAVVSHYINDNAGTHAVSILSVACAQ